MDSGHGDGDAVGMETPSDEGAEGLRPEGVVGMQPRLRGLGRAVVPAVDTSDASCV